jgi:hypothetical protein
MKLKLNFILLSQIGISELIVLALILAIIIILPVIFYLITLQNTFLAISEENRKMQPGLVWLTLIPLFGIVWEFVIVNRMADSLKAEFVKREIKVEEDRPGFNMGLAFLILSCCSIIPVLGAFAGIGAVVCWIIYWVQISTYKAKLQ